MSRPLFADVLILPALAAAVAAGTAFWWDDPGPLGGAGAMVENLAPHLAVLALALGLWLWLAGRRGVALATLLLALLGLGVTGARIAAGGVAPDPSRPADLTVLWFNLERRNPTPPEALIAALAESPARIVVLAEAKPLQAHRAALEAAFPQVTGCADDRRCELMVGVRDLDARVEFAWTGTIRPRRLVRIDLDEGPVTLIAQHAVKPWYGVFAETDDWLVRAELRRSPGAVALIGDFNAAPWSARMQALTAECDLGFARRAPATWPAALPAPLGLPIDLALAGPGTTLRSVTPWGAGLGSNHRGVLVEFALAGDAATVPETCLPEFEDTGDDPGTAPGEADQ